MTTTSLTATKTDDSGVGVTLEFTLTPQGIWKCYKRTDHGYVALPHLDATSSTEAFGTLHRYVTGDLMGVMLMTAQSA